MTTIDDAKAILNSVLAERDRIDADVSADFYSDDDDGAPHIMVPLAEFRTLLAHTADYDALKGRLEEAERLMGPAIKAGTTRSPFGSREALAGWAFDLSAFIGREKEAGRG